MSAQSTNLPADKIECVFSGSLCDATKLSAATVTSVSIHYGINSIPVLALELDAPELQNKGSELLCTPDKFKDRTKYSMTLKMKTKTGCITFDGYLDGVSISKSVGSIHYTAIIKNKFQRLLEIYPKMAGIMPNSFSIFRSADGLRIQHGDSSTRFKFAMFKIGTTEIDLNKSIGIVMLDFIKALVESQFQWQLNTNINADDNTILQMFNEKTYKANLEESKKLLDKTDISFIRKCAIEGAECADGIAELTIGDADGSLWELMVRVFEYLGCCLLIGNETLFVIPQASFLKQSTRAPNLFEKTYALDTHASNELLYNTAYPAQYSNFSINDSGFTNLKSCYVALEVDKTASFAIRLPDVCTTQLGSYPPKGGDPEIAEDGSNGILIVNTSPFLLKGLNYGYASDKKVQELLADGGSPFTAAVDSPDVARQQMKATDDAITQQLKAKTVLLDQFAKLKFLQVKYGERTGQVTVVFNPNWVPGSTGSLYDRSTGLFIQFYVTSVSHTVGKSGNSGTAITNITFSSVRMGKSGRIPGVSKDELFSYSTDDMLRLQKQWTTDIL